MDIQMTSKIMDTYCFGFRKVPFSIRTSGRNNYALLIEHFFGKKPKENIWSPHTRAKVFREMAISP